MGSKFVKSSFFVLWNPSILLLSLLWCQPVHGRPKEKDQKRNVLVTQFYEYYRILCDEPYANVIKKFQNRPTFSPLPPCRPFEPWKHQTINTFLCSPSALWPTTWWTQYTYCILCSGILTKCPGEPLLPGTPRSPCAAEIISQSGVVGQHILVAGLSLA